MGGPKTKDPDREPMVSTFNFNLFQLYGIDSGVREYRGYRVLQGYWERKLKLLYSSRFVLGLFEGSVYMAELRWVARHYKLQGLAG